MSIIKTLREKQGLTQERLGEIINEKRTTISMWETAGTLPHASKLPLLAKTLHCTVDELLADQEMKYKAKSDHIA